MPEEINSKGNVFSIKRNIFTSEQNEQRQRGSSPLREFNSIVKYSNVCSLKRLLRQQSTGYYIQLEATHELVYGLFHTNFSASLLRKQALAIYRLYAPKGNFPPLAQDC